MAKKKTVVFSILGTTLDLAKNKERWNRWRPTVALCQHEDLLVDRLELLRSNKYSVLSSSVARDVAVVSPETEVREVDFEVDDPWDFEEMFAALHRFAAGYRFDTAKEDYLVHITTGTHVAQICLFLLTEARYLPGRLLQTSPPSKSNPGAAGAFAIIDLDLSRYDRIAQRFADERREGRSFLKSGIETRSQTFNKLIERVEQVAAASTAPILLLGPTGAGKSQLATNIFALKKAKNLLPGEAELVEVNCATLRGDQAMSTLFGHVKGAFTGAMTDRPGFLRKAHKGLLFLDEVGELGLDEQAMLLRAIEQRTFYPVGSDKPVSSDFQLIAGTNRDLGARVRDGKFREDLLARIDLWTFSLPSLVERREDLAPNLDFELDKAGRSLARKVTMSKEARSAYLRFALDERSVWSGNFRDLNASVTRMATLAQGGRIDEETVAEETARLDRSWGAKSTSGLTKGLRGDRVGRVLGAEAAAALDRFDRVQLEDVLAVCAGAKSLSDAGRVLFAGSRAKKASVNDADRLRKYLARFELDFATVSAVGGGDQSLRVPQPTET
jgi:transcriptional regulatory protein RtcR